MSTLLSAQSISYQTTSAPLLEDISFTLKKGDRIGLVGHNGCGKSTLLNLLHGGIQANAGTITTASHCQLECVEQHLPQSLLRQSMMDAVLDRLPDSERLSQRWRAELILSEMGFDSSQWSLAASGLSGGQHTRLLLARALIVEPDLLLLDEPSNHLDLTTLLWLEQFLLNWNGSFVLVSHDRRLLDNTTNCTWILRDNSLHFFQLPCSQALEMLEARDDADMQRHQAEQKEIDRIEKSAKRLAVWGHVYDNEDLSRKAKNMEKRVEKLKGDQTILTCGTPWKLELKGERLKADRLLQISDLDVSPSPKAPCLFNIVANQLKSGDRVAIVGKNGGGKSTLLKTLWQSYHQDDAVQQSIVFHPRANVGFYDQSLKQLDDNKTLLDALASFTSVPEEKRKMALISAGFPYLRHNQKVHQLSGGERSRLLLIGLTLANYHLLLLDEPTNHLDLKGKEELAETLANFSGGLLLVTHDRELIEASCNRFWYIKGNSLEEWLDPQQLYQAMSSESSLASNETAIEETQVATPFPLTDGLADEEQLIEKLYDLETKLEEDVSRKTKHQKPKLQALWRKEIALINQQLGIE
ncbi:ABC-F family ATP-binding cassette domain-containing protein [Vibrio sp. T11.5]|uniref:ABC-F family ATP-binding cassette domain-containing protein n=1 Tax=Vibrio sp. T11.5 TaxID=2998836 RepID=UPI0022CD84A5|nr:ABC-F family ATP-binding cassette domain-containing protein [Vibrio sp. T11.5]MDA0118085.1 ABC-F family ATP-binding cassette domain-containing protein [Vibrio sp. T11.5]